jgi:trk system potassium uptake protein TrkA
MNIIVVGCGRIGGELAYRLYQKGHKVVVIDQLADSFLNLPLDFRGRTLEGNALSQDVLYRADIETADALAAVTNSDSINAVMAHLARAQYNVPSVVVRNYDSRWRPLLEVFNQQMVTSSSWGAQRIEELLYQQETRIVFSAGNGEVEVFEFMIPDKWDGYALQEILPSGDYVVVALTRAGRAFLPDRDTKLENGDVVLISATSEGSQAVRQRLKGTKPEHVQGDK